MEEGLLLKERLSERRVRWREIGEEMKRLGYLAGPMVAVTLSHYLLQVISLMMVGHLGELSLSSTAMAFSLAGVTVRYGQRAGNDKRTSFWLSTIRKTRTQTYTAIFSLVAALYSSVRLWIYMGNLLKFVAKILRFRMKLENSQCGLFLHFWLCYFTTVYSVLSNAKLNSADAHKLMRYSILEWWSFELLILLSGLLPNPQLETSVLSVCLNTIATLYAIPYGLAAAARISNELGAGKPEGARVSVIALTLLAAVDAIVQRKEVVDYVTNMAPLVCLSVIMDSLQGALSGVARGCGWQHIGAYINLAAFYLFGIPIAAILGFWLNFRGKGLWIGVLSGASLQTVMLAIITSCTNWEKQAAKARDRLFEIEE
ncbi:hypothetical protein DH2020_032032 [Rehmannia glutinosa]|uniref:Uncharacterized protein n=1 Tax=Rehmannia glutinosa TaxID=99300 RepID=A0ABR0VH59_REHGL